MSLNMKGLNLFIQDIRKCTSPEEESQRVDKELKKIRAKFLSKTNLSGYHRKKYVWKLLSIKLMGYDVNFGYKEVLLLLSSSKYSEKYTGYITAPILIPEYEEDIYSNLKTAVRNDLFSSMESVQSLALNLLGGLANQQLAISLVNDVLKVALGESNNISFNTRKKALLCLLRIYRKYKDSFENVRGWIQPLNMMLERFSNNFSVLNAVLTLVEGVVSLDYTKYWDALSLNIVKILNNVVVNESCPQDYLHYLVPHPWLQIKALKILSMLSVRKEPEFLQYLSKILQKILSRTTLSTVKNKNNTEYSILFEAVQVIIRYKAVIDLDLQYQLLSLVVMFLEVQDVNVKYLALDSMTMVLVLPGSEDAMKEQFTKILEALKDIDMSSRRRALYLLYLMCNGNNVGEIIEELLNYSETTDMMIKEELVLKIAILAEKFAPDLNWYIDVVIRLLTKSGDYITDDIWWRLCQIATGFGKEGTNPQLQQYSVGAVVSSLQNTHIHENLVKLGAYILPEFSSSESGHLSAARCFSMLHKEFELVSSETKCLLLNAYAKIAQRLLFKGDSASEEEMTAYNQIISLFQVLVDNIDVEIQKRACEYLAILETNDLELMGEVFRPMPVFPESVEENNPLLSKMIHMLTKDKKNAGVDPTLQNEAKRLIKTQNQILMAQNENKTILRQKGTGYEDLFIDAQYASIKFAENPLFEQSRNRLALAGKNILLTPENIQLPKICFREFQNLLLTSSSGILYEDNGMRVDFKSEFSKASGRAAFQFVSKSGPLKVHKASVLSEGGLQIQISPVKDGPSPQLMMNFMNTDNVIGFPTLSVFYNLNSQEKNLNLTLPIFVHRFISAYAMDDKRYMEVYARFTTGDAFFKLDEFIKYPAPPHVPLNDVMRKIGSLLTNLNFKAMPYPNLQNIRVLLASGQLERSNQESPSIPIIVEIECYENSREYLRLSIRSGANPLIVHSVYQIIMFFLTC